MIRPARREDVPAIVALLAAGQLGPLRDDAANPAHLDAFDLIDADPRNQLVVAEIEGRVAGTLQLTFIPHLSQGGSERAHIEGVRVAEDLRGTGVGRALVEWALARARERGCVTAQLLSDARRAEALAFYERLGFRPTHRGLKRKL